MAIAGDFHPNLFMIRLRGVLLFDSCVASVCRASCGDKPWMPYFCPRNSTRFDKARMAETSLIWVDSLPVPLQVLRQMIPVSGACSKYFTAALRVSGVIT